MEIKFEARTPNSEFKAGDTILVKCVYPDDHHPSDDQGPMEMKITGIDMLAYRRYGAFWCAVHQAFMVRPVQTTPSFGPADQ